MSHPARFLKIDRGRPLQCARRAGLRRQPAPGRGHAMSSLNEALVVQRDTYRRLMLRKRLILGGLALLLICSVLDHRAARYRPGVHLQCAVGAGAILCHRTSRGRRGVWTMGSLTKHRGDYRVDASPGLQGRGADRTMQPRTAPHPDRRYRLSAICIRRAQRVAHYFSYRPGPRPERMTISA